MKKSTITAVFNSPIEKVWDKVTDNTSYSWRSDLSRIETAPEGTDFWEYTKDGFGTKFVIKCKQAYERYEFDIENKNMTGSWTGIFTKVESGTRIDFTEEVEVKNIIMKLFVNVYLKRQQEAYIADLRRALEE